MGTATRKRSTHSAVSWEHQLCSSIVRCSKRLIPSSNALLKLAHKLKSTPLSHTILAITWSSSTTSTSMAKESAPTSPWLTSDSNSTTNSENDESLFKKASSTSFI